jgi:DNA-binding PadR family transcriptional regulator
MSINPIEEMNKDHKMVRDILLKLLEEIEKKNVEGALEMLLELDKLGGPHFRAEEETMYPILRRFFGDEYYNRLLEEHDRVIRAGRKIAEMLGKGSLTDEEAEELINLIRRDILPHPVTCEGLGIFMERLTADELKRIGESIIKARKEGVPLLQWAESIRERKV